MDKTKLIKDFNIYEIDTSNIPEKDMESLYKIALEKWGEEHPELMKPTFSEVKREHRDSIPSDIINKFIVRDNENNGFIGYATLGYIKRDVDAPEEEKDKAWVGIRIRKEYRRRGIGTDVLKLLTLRVSNLNIKKITSGARTKSGKSFSEKFGGELSSRSYYSFLNLKKCNWKRIEEINFENKSKNSDIKLKTFFGINDKNFDNHFTKIAEYMEEVSEYSTDWDFDKDFFLREVIPEEKKAKERGVKKLYVYAYQNEKIIGVSELRIEPENSKEIYTEITGIDRDFRGRGLCKLLKTELLLKIKKDFPDIELITTGNDEDNSAIRKVNKEFGFKQLEISKGYIFDVDNLKKRLGL